MVSSRDKDSVRAQKNIQLEWETIGPNLFILLNYFGEWTWEEHDERIDHALQLVHDAQAPAFIAFNLRENSYMPPGGFAAHMRYTLQAFSTTPLLQGAIYIMMTSPLNALITTAYNTYAPEVPVYFAHSIDEAADIAANS